MKNISATLLLSFLVCFTITTFVICSSDADALKNKLMSDYIIHQMRYQRSAGSGSIPIHNSGYQNFENMGTAEPSIEAFKRAESSVKEFIKKSLADSKSLRFHQCYFNPISCFRR